jgi:hypothetical protein
VKSQNPSPRLILVSRYQIIRSLGNSGMGVVYLASDLRCGYWLLTV